MKKALHLMLALALFVCGFNVNAQRNANHNVMTSVEKQDVKKKARAPEVRVMDVEGAAITIIDSKYHFPYDISDNKQHVAIQAFGESESYYWSEATGMIYINGTVFSVSDDGIISGYYTNDQGVSVAGLWYSDVKEWQFLGMNPDYPEFFLDMDKPDYNGAWAMSNDGLHVGVRQFTAEWESSSYLWTPNDGYSKLPNGTSTQTRLNGISSDGSIIVGHGTDEIGYWTACYWKDGEIYNIEDLYGEAMNASPNGRFICGYVDGMEGNAFVYDINNSELTQIPNTLEVGSSLSATCVTDNGDAFGYLAGGFPPMPDMRRAFAYVGGEVMYFNDYLLANGVGEAESWIIYSINNVTADGRTFIGAANIDGQDCSFIITLEESLCDGPTNLTYSIPENDYNNVILSWEAPADPVDVTYEIYTGYTATEPIYAGITETSFEIEDLETGSYSFLVRANWGGECLSNGSNTVKPTIYPCAAENMWELTFTMIDQYGDGWNNGYIQIVGTLSDMIYKVELKQGGYIDEPTVLVLPLCHDTYTFTWVKGEWDSEVGFSIYMGENELYSIETGSIGDSFSNPFFVLRLEGIDASISDVTYTSAFCSTENNFNINVVNEGLEEITSLKMQVVVDGTNAGDGNWLYYDDGVCNDGIGGLESFYWGIMLPASTLKTYVGSYMTKVSVFDRAVSSGDIMIYYGGSSSPQNLIHVQPYSLSGTNEFVEFDLTSALPVNSRTNVWVIFSTTQGTNYPASQSVNTGDPNRRWISLDGSTWGDVLVDYDLDATWMIRAYVTDEIRTSVSELMPITDYNCNISEGVLKASGMSVNNTNNAERSGEIIEFTWQGNIPSYQSVDIETTLDLSLGSHNVKFQIVEINGEAFKSNRKSVTVDVEEGIDTYVDGNSGDYTIDIMQGRFDNNITWELLASDNSVIASGAPYELLSSNTIKLNTETVIIPAGECVKFIVRDNNGNGFSNGGYYRIFDGKGNVVVYNEGSFGYEQSHLLSVISDETMDDSYAENTFNVNVDVPGTLSYKLASMIEHWSDVYVLKVKGELNATDQQVFSKLTHLMTLDLTETNITSIGGCKELGRLRNVYLPATVTTVENEAFYYCKSLYSMDLSETTTIGNRSFSNCISLNSINIPNVTAIDYEAFYNCTSLTSIDIPNVKSLSDNNSGIFSQCTNLSEVILSDELTYIPQYCFYYCTSLKEIELPSSLESIGYSAFYYCAFTNINIPEGVTKLHDYAFYGCPVTTVSIPSTIITISYNIFSNGSITDVYCYAATPVTTSTFGGGLSYATLHVPEFSVVAYKVHDSWYKFGNIVPLDELLSDVYINSEYTIIDYTGLTDEVNLTLDLNAHLTVAAGSEFNLDSYKQITSNTEYYEYGDNNWNYTYYYPSTLITYNEMNADSVEVSLTLRTDRWNFISLPFDVNVSDITYPEGTLWVVRKYSGEDRALMTGNTWHNMTDGMTLNAGEGYILHCDHADKSFVTFTFTAVNNESMNNMFSHYDVELPLATYPSEFAHNRSWNLVGNPYPSYFNTNENIEHNGIITVWDNGYVAYSLLDDYFTLKPYESFFVQCPEGVNSMLFKAEGRSHTNDYDDYEKREEAFKQRNSIDRKIYNFTLANEDYNDRTRLVINENASTEYEISCDASKFMNDDESVPQVYIYDNEIIYAINERPLGLGMMTIGIRIGQAGEYTLTLEPKEDYNQNVVLYDNITGDEIDILNESYIFTAEEGYDYDRFVLTITENTIGIEENVIIDINDPDVEVFDIMGRRVRVSDDMKGGVYILRKGNIVQRYFIYE